MNGLLLIDKPAGMTSHDVVAKVRWAARTRKVGHTGTLDPDATGLLPVTIGSCTKLSQYLLLDRKTYHFTMTFGWSTETDDASGEVVERADFSHVSAQDIEGALGAFRGEIMQRPPRYSAIRVDGKRAYDLARAGVEFELPERPVFVERLELERVEMPRAHFVMRCGSGTYVRSLVRDLGERLGSRAHTSMIRRTEVGGFLLEDAVKLEELSRDDTGWHERVLSGARMMAQLAQYVATPEHVEALRYGKRVVVAGDDTLVRGQMMSVVDESGELVAVCEVQEERGEGYPGHWVRPKRVLSAHD